MRRLRPGRSAPRAVLVAAGVLTMVVAATVPSAGVPDLPIGSTTTTSEPPPSSSSSSSSTTSSAPTTTTTLLPVTTSTEPQTTTTTAPAETVEPPAVPPTVPEPGGDGAPPLDEALDARVVPDWAVDMINSVPRTSGRSTDELLGRLEPLLAFGFTPAETARVGFGRFPVSGRATYGDDWWYPRFTPTFHLHEGTDVFADFGTPITAPADGVLTMGEGPVGGRYVYLTLDDGTYLYFSHLDAFAELPDDRRIADPVEAARYHVRAYDQPVAYRVGQGDVIGTVGDSGNARGGAPHVHFEYHPEGGEPVNPKPILDQWLDEAEAAVDEVIALYTSRGPKAVITTQRTRSGGTSQFAAPSRPLSTEMLGVTALGPGTGVHVVNRELSRAVSRIDWEALDGGASLRPLEEVAAALADALGVR